MKYTVCTTFNANGYNTYGSRMIDTFLQNWPQEIMLRVYAESCEITQTAPNLQVLDLASASPELVAFKNTWRDVPRANGHPGPPYKGKEFKYQAVRFSHKVYAIFHAANTATTEWLIWMDADMVCHSPITMDQLAGFFPDSVDLCFAGRTRKYTECGLYGMHLTRPEIRTWLADFQRMYDHADQGIFALGEWHDSFVFDTVRQRHALRELNWSAHLEMGEGHPLINCAWGAYIDHLKGERKSLGRSKSKDLQVDRHESYWK